MEKGLPNCDISVLEEELCAPESLEVHECQPESVRRASPAVAGVAVHVRAEVPVTADEAAKVAALVMVRLPRWVGEVPGSAKFVVRREVRPVALRDARVLDVLPAALGEEAVIAAREKPRPVLERLPSAESPCSCRQSSGTGTH